MHGSKDVCGQVTPRRREESIVTHTSLASSPLADQRLRHRGRNVPLLYAHVQSPRTSFLPRPIVSQDCRARCLYHRREEKGSCGAFDLSQRCDHEAQGVLKGVRAVGERRRQVKLQGD